MWSKRELASQVFVRSGLSSLLRKQRRQGALVLNYHRIGDPSRSPLDRGLFSATPEAFDWQMAFLKRECQIVTPDDILHDDRLVDGNFVAVTFDDGYRDNYELALPILKAHGVTATFFIATGYIDRPRVPWWDEIAWIIRSSSRTHLSPSLTLPVDVTFDPPDRQAAIDQVLGIYKTLPGEATHQFLDDLAAACGVQRCPEALGRDLWMTWDMIRQMRDAGMVIGGHTVNHPILSHLSPMEQEEEIIGCSRRLQEQLNSPMRFFAYPRGKQDAYNQDTRACLYEAKVELSFTYDGGFNVPGQIDAYDVKRVAVETETHKQGFDALVSLPTVFSRP